jgi:hypothetical protein
MYGWVLILHSVWRWIVVVAGLAAVTSSVLALCGCERRLSAGIPLTRLFSIALDIQVLLGAALYLLLSPLTTVVPSMTSVRLPLGSAAYDFTAVHPLIMIAAFIVVHISSVVVARARSETARHRRAVILYGLTLLLVLFGIPWWRPWLRF